MKRNIFLSIIFIFLHGHINAHVELKYPKGGETFIAGQVITIEWEELASHNTLNWDLYFSSDGGNTWEIIKENISVGILAYNWEVPDIATNEAQVRVVQDNELVNYSDISENFMITSTTTINNTFEEQIRVFPNPATSYFIIEFKGIQITQASFWLYNENGGLVKKVQNVPLSGKTIIRIEGLANGVYLYKLIKEPNTYLTGKIIIK